jgi:hypothetical protein
MNPPVRPPLNLLLALGKESEEPCLLDGLGAEALDAAPRLELSQEEGAVDFGNEAADPCSLPERRWGLVVPREESLRRSLLEALAPLIALRAEQVGHASAAALLAHDVYPVDSDPELSEHDAQQWYRCHYQGEGEHELLRRDLLDRPDYLLLVGDLHQVPESIHRVLMQSGCFVGRLAFTLADGSADLDAYRRYADKVVAWERAAVRRPRGSAPARALVVADGSMATELGARQLVGPLLTRALFKRRDVNEAAAVALDSREELCRVAAELTHGVLLTVSHGYGGPRTGFGSGLAQRAEQGSMSFLRREPRLSAHDLGDTSQAFVPGGMWLMFACYSAGTPAQSHYHRWLRQHKDQRPGGMDWMLAALPRSGGDFRPFIAALPQALLGRSDGPLAFVGHLDLAWAYSFQTPGGSSDPDLFRCFLGALLDGVRIGAAFQFVQRKLREIEASLLNGYHLLADLEHRPEAAAKLWTPARAQRMQELWMMRQDLAGFVILGDPAAELPLLR